MSKLKNEISSPYRSVFAGMGELMQETASAMEEKKKVSDQLGVLVNAFKGVDSRIKKLDLNATAKWMECLSENSEIVSNITSHFDKQKVDVANVRLDVVDALIEATENISKILSDLSFGLMVPRSFNLKDKHVSEIKERSWPVKYSLKKLAANLHASCFGLRVFAGLDPNEKQGFNSVLKKCNCCGGEKTQTTKDAVDMLDLDLGIATTVGGQGEDLNEYVSEINNDLEHLKEVIMLLALYLIWLSGQAFLASNAGGPPCDDECTPSANVIGTSVVNVTAALVPTTLRIFQPQCNVIWDFCCTNICFIFYEENFVVSVTTGPHNLGPQVRLVAGQNAKAAQLIANRRAANFRPINSLVPPAKPAC